MNWLVRERVWLAVAASMIACCYCFEARAVDRLTYLIQIDSDAGLAKVQIAVPANDWLKQLNFNEAGFKLQRVEGNGDIERGEGRLNWLLPQGDASLSYTVPLASVRHQENKRRYAAYHNDRWLIMRADDLIPPFRARFRKGVEVNVTLRFVLPRTWQSVYTNYPRLDENEFELTGGRTVTRPTGWLIAGEKLSARHEHWSKTYLSIVGPADHDVRPMEILALFGISEPHFDALLGGKWPNKLLIVSAGEPMWRGGLSADLSLFMHSQRPLISENGTSTLLHELFHVLVGITAATGYDWITEGLAEYYSVHILRQAGAYTGERESKIFGDLSNWGKTAQTLRSTKASGAVTARAAALFRELDNEIEQLTNFEHSLDDIVRVNVDNKKITLAKLSDDFKQLTGARSKVLAKLEEE